MRILIATLIIALLLICGGCSKLGSNSGSGLDMNSKMNSMVKQYHQNDEAFSFLEKQFKTSNVFTESEAYKLSQSQQVIQYLINYVEEEQKQGGVSYYEMLAYYGVMRQAYFDMETILDAYIEYYDDPVQVIYNLTKRDVNQLIDDVNKLLADVEQEGGDIALEELPDKLVNLIAALEPLVGTITL